MTEKPCKGSLNKRMYVCIMCVCVCMQVCTYEYVYVNGAKTPSRMNTVGVMPKGAVCMAQDPFLTFPVIFRKLDM